MKNYLTLIHAETNPANVYVCVCEIYLIMRFLAIEIYTKLKADWNWKNTKIFFI